MDLHHEFTVPVPAADAWKILTDLERLAPCLPGAQLTEIEGDIYRGQVKIKVGPILAQFKGQASFVSRDDANFLASLKAEGRDTGGKGNASATITARLEPVSASSAKCTVDTQLNISGKVAPRNLSSQRLMQHRLLRLQRRVRHPLRQVCARLNKRKKSHHSTCLTPQAAPSPSVWCRCSW